MLHIKLNEDTDFLDNDFLTKSDLPIDIQWKIYRGTLSRQSLPINSKSNMILFMIYMNVHLILKKNTILNLLQK